MGTPTQYYVDPAIAADSGAGTVGDPYGDLQYALDTITQDATNGDQINIKAGTDEILGASLSLASYGGPTRTKPLIFRGYTSAADDGGIGGIDGNATYSMMAVAAGNIHFVDLHMHNSGANLVLSMTTWVSVQNCEIDTSTVGGLKVTSDSLVIGCYIHDTSGYLLDMGSSASQTLVINNTLESGGSSPTAAIRIYRGIVTGNVISVDGATDGITLQTIDGSIFNNSIWSNGGTGQGIITTTTYPGNVFNNIVEGFSGVGGVGIQMSGQGMFYANNAVYNNATDYSVTAAIINDAGNNETLLASPFANASTGDFTVDTTVKATAFPTGNYNGLSVRTYLDKGALQREEAGAGGGTSGRQGLHPIESGAV